MDWRVKRRVGGVYLDVDAVLWVGEGLTWGSMGRRMVGVSAFGWEA